MCNWRKGGICSYPSQEEKAIEDQNAKPREPLNFDPFACRPQGVVLAPSSPAQDFLQCLFMGAFHRHVRSPCPG